MRVLNFLLVTLLSVALVAACAKKKEEAAQTQQAAPAAEQVQLNKCVVCGMEIPADADTITVEYQGKVYHFCSVEDKQKFLANPEQYVKPDTTAQTEAQQ